MIGYCDREFPGCTVWGLKKGDYIHYGNKLAEHFPKARFIHLVRDGRAVFSSKKKALHSSLGRPLEASAIRAAERWNRFSSSFETLLGANRASVIEVSYEKLITDSRETLERIFGFLGVESDVSLTADSFRPLDPTYVTDRSRHLHPNVGKSPQSERIDAWKKELSPKEILAYEMVAGENLARKGYKLVNPDAHRRPTLAYRVRRSLLRLRESLTSGKRP
jgi:hypothetical protein